MKCVYFFLIVIIFNVVLRGVACAQDARLRQYVGDSRVTAFAETEKFLWIGTEKGMYCVRKRRSKVHHMTTKNSILMSDTVTCIVAKQDGEVYIGTRKGIVRYDNYAFLSVSDENSGLRSNNITSLVCVHGDEVYAGTYDGGITLFSGLRSKTFTSANSQLANNYVVSMEKVTPDSLVAFLQNNLRAGIRKKHLTMLAKVK